jgi:hypothetical protein
LPITGVTLQCVPLRSDHDGVARVVSALISHHVTVVGGQKVDDLGFAFVSPLRADYDGDGHARSSR